MQVYGPIISEQFPIGLEAYDIKRPDLRDPVRRGLVELCSQIAIVLSMFPEADEIMLLDHERGIRHHTVDQDGFLQRLPLPEVGGLRLKSFWRRDSDTGLIKGEVGLPSANKTNARTQVYNQAKISGEEGKRGAPFNLSSIEASRQFFRVNDLTLYIHPRALTPQAFVKDINSSLDFLHSSRSKTSYQAK